MTTLNILKILRAVMDQLGSGCRGWCRATTIRKPPTLQKKIFCASHFSEFFLHVTSFDSPSNPAGWWLVSFYREKVRLRDVV